MKEINNVHLMTNYLNSYQLNSIFPEALIPYFKLYSCEQGEYICSQGEPSQNLYILVKGKVKIYTTSPDGKTLILSFKNPLEVIGDIEYVQKIDIINTVEAVSSVHMIGVNFQVLEKYGEYHAPLLKFLLDIITKKFYLKSHSMSLNLMYPVEVRLASYLLSVSFEEGNSHKMGHLSTVKLTDVANLIGTSYRHLNRVIGQFCLDGLVERSNGFIIVRDLEGLRARASHNIYE